jgi:hypothetical protein
VSKFQKGEVVYRAWIVEFEGEWRPLAILSSIAAVCPQRGGSFKYHTHIYDVCGSGMVRSAHNVEEGALYSDALDAMVAAIEAAARENTKPTGEGSDA